MKVLIVEDETAAFDNLVEILAGIDPMIDIMGNTESVDQTVRWLKQNPAPDLIFMDVNLSDGTAFSIFNRTTVEVPIIFVTAYDQYAIQAFKVNSIDYLLKPINAEDVEAALRKFQKWGNRDVMQYLERLARFSTPGNYRDKLIIQVKDRLLPVNVKDIAYFYATNRMNILCTMGGEQYPLKVALDQLVQTLNPGDFIRANKQFVINREHIREIAIWFDSRLLVKMQVDTPEPIYISKNKSAEFKHWLEKNLKI